jgi:hypothetical protein
LESVHSTTAASSTNSDSKFLPEETKNSIGTNIKDYNFINKKAIVIQREGGRKKCLKQELKE